jgi:hypothetical protein
MIQKSLIPLLSLLVLFSSACGKETDADKIADAQNCLDSATTAEAAACVSKVDGMESSGAYLIRCVGKFVKEGFSQPSKISNALASATGSGSTGSAAMMASLAFTTESTDALNNTSAQQAFGYCTKAKSEGLIFLSGTVQIATSVGYLAGVAGGIENMDGDELKTAMGTMKDDPVAQAAVGSAVVGIYESSCSGGNNATGDFCAQFNGVVASAGGASNTNAIGQLVMTCYANPADAACVGLSGF